MLDRNYPSIKLFDFLQNDNIKFIVRIKKLIIKKNNILLVMMVI